MLLLEKWRIRVRCKNEIIAVVRIIGYDEAIET